MNKIEFEAIEKFLKASSVEKLIKNKAAYGLPLIVSDVPGEWQDKFRAHGFCEYARYQDYWLEELIPPGAEYNDYSFLQPEECAAASELTAACRGQSRGFEGETPEWFSLWLRGEEEGQRACRCRNAAVLTHKTNGKIDGISCTATYAHGSEKGAVIWLRELAVHPDFQGWGIGRKLLAQTLRYGAEHGARRAFLHTDTQNAAAIHIYTDAGFRPREGEEQTDMIWRKV